jgi:hypothetical protein
MIYNIINGTFEKNGIRVGDLVAMVNFVQWYRKDQNNPNIKFHLRPGVLVNEQYIYEFYHFLNGYTDCFSTEEGFQTLPYNNVNLWDFRDITGDHISIYNTKQQEDKVVVFPIVDATYHTTRNWTDKIIDDTLKFYSEQYPDSEKLLCVKDLPITMPELYGFSISTNFMANIRHIMTARVFVGGDTGSSHFAWALNPGPEVLHYYNNSRGMIHTLPFYLLEGKGKIFTYYLNLTAATLNGKLIEN